jgi:hypothetical protein
MWYSSKILQKNDEEVVVVVVGQKKVQFFCAKK